MDVPDSIEREVILPVPPARVWSALTRADQLGAWFATSGEIDLRPGGEVVLTWDGSTGPRGISRSVIGTVDLTVASRFDGRPIPATAATTRVEFTLESHAEGTRLLVVESAFASLPREWRTHESQVEGCELSELTGYLAMTRAAIDRTPDAVFAALADPTRRRVLRLVADLRVDSEKLLTSKSPTAAVPDRGPRQ